jgi:hypothetical protein
MMSPDDWDRVVGMALLLAAGATLTLFLIGVIT